MTPKSKRTKFKVGEVVAFRTEPRLRHLPCYAVIDQRANPGWWVIGEKLMYYVEEKDLRPLTKKERGQ